MCSPGFPDSDRCDREEMLIASDRGPTRRAILNYLMFFCADDKKGRRLIDR